MKSKALPQVGQLFSISWRCTLTSLLELLKSPSLKSLEKRKETQSQWTRKKMMIALTGRGKHWESERIGINFNLKNKKNKSRRGRLRKTQWVNFHDIFVSLDFWLSFFALRCWLAGLIFIELLHSPKRPWFQSMWHSCSWWVRSPWSWDLHCRQRWVYASRPSELLSNSRKERQAHRLEWAWFPWLLHWTSSHPCYHFSQQRLELCSCW